MNHSMLSAAVIILKSSIFSRKTSRHIIIICSRQTEMVMSQKVTESVRDDIKRSEKISRRGEGVRPGVKFKIANSGEIRVFVPFRGGV